MRVILDQMHFEIGELLSGSNVTFDLSVEANLDLQYSMSLVGPNQRVTLYQVGDKKQGNRKKASA